MSMTGKFIGEVIKIFHSDHPLMQTISDIIEAMNFIWHYPIYISSDNHSVEISNIIIGIIVFIISLRMAKYFSKLISRRLIKNSKMEVGVVKSLERISYYILILLFTIFVLDISNVPLTALTVVGTTLALGVGLGSQNVANNFISGLIIMIERPIKLGDIIEIKALGVVGTVMNIGARCVSIRSDNNINVLIPNSLILQDTLINWTLDDKLLKTKLPISIERGDYSLEQIDEIFYQALDRNPNILKKPAPQILLNNIDKDGLHYELVFSFSLDVHTSSNYVLNSIYRDLEPMFRENNIKVSSNDTKSKS